MIKKAKKEEAYLKLAVTGPSGGGKTYGSLLIAKGLLGSLEKVVVLDTENGSANLYADLGDYSVLPLAPPFHPDRFCKAIDYCIQHGFTCIIIDSATHEWDGEGGCLDIYNKLGGRFQDWAKVTPMHQNFINKLLNAPAHIIATARRKQDYLMNNESGKMKIEKVGLKEIQREGFEYEFTTVLSVDINHNAVASKDRTQLFDTVTPFRITEETGKSLAKWLKS